MTVADLKSFLTRPYQRDGWLQTLRGVLPQTEIFSLPQPLASADARAESVFQLGRVQLQGDRQLGILEVRVGEDTDLARNRVGLRNLVSRFIDQAEYHGMLSVFLTPRPDYRFTFASRESAFDTEGNLVRNETAPRRYTYLLGPGESCRTPAERFAELAMRGKDARIKDLVEAFNVDKLNKEFFTDYRNVFQRVAADIRQRNPNTDAALAEREAQTLLNRLLFLCFVQRKGWLNRQRDYLFRNFREHAQKRPDGITFHQQFLKPLFIKLATEGGEADIPGHDLPFLNGGLFVDEYGAEQRGEAARRSYSLKIGNDVFQHVFADLLEAYNFTVREDSPLSVEVAIDPEMLGKVFESLVLQLEQSDTGGKTSRHDTGSFYTPRPIVHYLCREGLRGWLEQFPPAQASAADWPQRLEKLLALDASDGIDPTERATLDACLTPEEARAILDRLDEFRACDLAVGSGAFPVGLLHELLNLRRLCETRSRGKDPVETDSHWLYETKARIIERCLYGVDIQERAIEICKLRLWLSLMVDHPLEADVDSCSAKAFRDALKKITPLPNLDFKIRRANSLVDYIHGEPVELGQLSQETGAAMPLSKLTGAKREFFKARTAAAKRKLRFDIYGSLTELAKIELTRARTDAAGFGMALTPEAAARVAELGHGLKEIAFIAAQIHDARKMRAAQQDEALERIRDRFEDPQKPTFVWQLDFAEVFHRTATGHARTGDDLLAGEPEPPQPEPGHPGGFGLVLANPPYVRMELFKAIKPELRTRYPQVHSDRADLYCYFYARAAQLLCQGGVLSFISSNKFFRAGYGEPLRQFLAKTTELRAVIDFGDLPIFEAVTYPCIVVARNRDPDTKRSILTLNVRTDDQLAHFTEMPMTPLPQAGFAWRLESQAILDLLSKIRQAGAPLGKFVQGRIFRGIVSGCNEAFIISGAQRLQILAESRAADKIIKPYLGGKHVRRWACERPDQWMLYLPHGANTDGLDAVTSHLAQFRKKLEQRATEQAWYELQQPQEKFTTTYSQPKIIFPDIAPDVRFAYDPNGAFFSNTAYCIGSDSMYLLGILNSAAVQHFYIHLSAQIRGGYLRFWTQYVEQIPIPDASKTDRAAIESLVEKCLAAHGANCDPWESEINDRVYRLYGLTKDEIIIVEGPDK
ncbi:MAG TPA: TaqI-like C-terminal specificity domain-containing protein [Verrucomicrobiae bacterium]|nr:TaqI-like C-terminal specificity domain-containing protein [Verrucomicrobiae bacterium]